LSKAGRYRDILQRIEALKNIGESPAVNTPKSNGSIILDEATTRPTLGRYEIIAELGQGAMGTVYLGLDPKINREVAIKTLSYGNVNEEKLDEIKGRFLREAEAAGKLSHPNIVTIFDVGEEHDMAYIAMELLKGKVLTEFCSKENALSVQKVLEVVAAVAKALDYAHANGVVHRDIKPDNIILLEGGQVKVADFGIARVTSASNTQTGVIMGTPNYMSPEQVEGLHVDGRSDLFSLGVVMYELLACARPFHGDNVAHLMYKIAAADYTPLDKTAPKTPPCCLWIVKKLLTKDPAKRIPSAAKLVHKIQQCQSALA
jgi:serine/threonine-protein kinase